MRSVADKDLFTNFIRLCKDVNRVKPEAVLTLQTECLNLPEESYPENYQHLTYTCTSLAFLNCFFVWDSTGDGFDYWNSVYYKLCDLEIERR